MNEWQPAVVVKGHREAVHHESDDSIAAIWNQKIRVCPVIPSDFLIKQRLLFGYAGDDRGTKYFVVHPEDLERLGIRILGVPTFCEHEILTD